MSSRVTGSDYDYKAPENLVELVGQAADTVAGAVFKATVTVAEKVFGYLFPAPVTVSSIEELDEELAGLSDVES